MGSQLNTVLEAIKNNHRIRQRTYSVLPYSKQELKELEQAIKKWLKQLKIISEDVGQLSDVMHVVRNGVLLCDLVALIFNTKITGVFRQPLSTTTQ